MNDPSPLFYTGGFHLEPSSMSTAAVSETAKHMPSPALRRYAWGVLAYFIAVILWGTLVRATGSGAGCGDHWPLCNGTVMQHSASANTMIEFTHRITSGLSFFAVVALVGVDLCRHRARTPGARHGRYRCFPYAG